MLPAFTIGYFLRRVWFSVSWWFLHFLSSSFKYYFNQDRKIVPLRSRIWWKSYQHICDQLQYLPNCNGPCVSSIMQRSQQSRDWVGEAFPCAAVMESFSIYCHPLCRLFSTQMQQKNRRKETKWPMSLFHVVNGDGVRSLDVKEFSRIISDCARPRH